MKTTLISTQGEVPAFLKDELDACVSYSETLEDGRVELNLVIAPDDLLYCSFADDQASYEVAHEHLRQMCALTPQQRKALP